MNKKIDIFADKKYIFSTDLHRTCKSAVAKVQEYIERYPNSYGNLKGKKITAYFDKTAR